MKNNFIRSALSLMCVLVLLIKGHQSFFIKHSQSGLCLKVEDDYFKANLNDWGANYYVKFSDGCLHSHAQFRYVDDTFVHNIEKNGTFLGRIFRPGGTDRYFNRYIVYSYTSITYKFVRSPEFALRHKSGTLKIYDGTYCATPSKSTKPFDGSYPVKTTTCDQDLQKFTFGSVTDKDTTMTDVNCASSQKMQVVKAEFGEFSDGKPFVYNNDTKCSSFALCFVKAHCDGKISCNMAADSNLFKLNQCPNTSRQLYMEYNCVDTPGTAITTDSKIRLSLSPYRGYIEVFNGTTWIPADDKKWSKEKEVALCHHLGFINPKSGFGNKTWPIHIGQMLASGDVYCYGTQTTNTSCCAQLVSSILTQSAKIPNVDCSICNEPLLEDTGKYPNHIFSASDGNGWRARVTNNGWCPTHSGSKYLQIDLQREYYITYIATFGDRAQTNWLESYSLQYSRTLAGLGSSTAKTTTANYNAYRASVVRLDIAHVRYLKITTEQGEDFCLRVQLCGHVLLPDPVQSVVVDTITARSARVSWSVPLNEGHGAVTYFLIFLNDTKKGNVTRKDNKNQYTLNDLKPYSNYEVTIEAGNVYGVGESASETFKTNKAVPDGPPLNVAVVSQNSRTLRVSWQSPRQDLLNGIITRYNTCYSTTRDKEKCFEVKSVTSYDIKNLQPAVEYFVKVSAGTKVGYGVFSQNINKITNQDPVVPSRKTYYSLNINVEKPRNRIQWILVIVQAASIHEKITDQYSSNELKPFNNGQVFPYVTAGLNVSGLSQTFVIGDGMWYNLSKASYFNQPLKEDTDYIVFLRFIESKDNYYSTDWSKTVKTFKKPAAPQITRIVSYGTNGLKISWMQPSLPKDQTAINHIVAYRRSSNILVTKETGSGSSTYILGCLEYKKKYFISVQTVTQAGESKKSNEMSRTTNSEPVLPPKKRNNSYTVTLRKPKDKSIQNVNLIVLQVQSESTIPTPPEEIKPVKFSDVRKQDDNVAFIAKEINVADFKENTIKVTLQVSDAKKRRRRASESNVVLDQDLVYRAAQFNYDTSGTSYPSYWSDSFVFSKASSTGTKSQLSDEGCSKTVLYVVISILLVIIAVLVVVVIYVCLRRPKLQPGVKDSVVNVENKTFSDGIYDEVQNPNPDSNLGNINPSAYEALDLRKKEQDQNTYQSLVKPTV